jgi:hypothetical protein
MNAVSIFNEGAGNQRGNSISLHLCGLLSLERLRSHLSGKFWAWRPLVKAEPFLQRPKTSWGHLFCRFFIGDGKTRLILKGR